MKYRLLSKQSNGQFEFNPDYSQVDLLHGTPKKKASENRRLFDDLRAYF
jgi:hypothetical protein